MASKSLTDSFVFRSMNKSNIINTNILRAIQQGEVLSLKEDLPESHMIIDRQFKYPLKHKVLEALEKGRLVLKFSPIDIKIPSSIPFVLFKDNNTVKAVIFCDIYTDKFSDGQFRAETKKLYCMMEAALVAIGYLENNRGMCNSPAVITSGAEIYSTMIMRVLNKKYSLIDKNKINGILFLASKFYMVSVLGLTPSETLDNYAKKSLRMPNMLYIDSLNDMFTEEDYKDISTFITKLTDDETELGLSGLTARGFLEAFINMYDSSAIYSLELFPYFVYNIISVLHSAYINNQYVLEDMVIGTTKSGAKLYNALPSYV